MERNATWLHLILQLILISLIVAGVSAFLYFVTTHIDQYASITYNVKPKFIFVISMGFIMGLFFSKDIIIRHIRYRDAKKSIDWPHLFVFLDLLMVVILFFNTWTIRRLILSISSTFNPFLLIPMLLGFFLPRIWKEDVE